MGRIVGFLVAFVLLFIAPVLCQVSITFNPPLSQGQAIATTLKSTATPYQFGYYNVIVIFDPSPDYTVTPSVLEFNSTIRELPFTITVNTLAYIYITITLNGTDAGYYNSPNAYKYVSLRGLDLSKGYLYFPPSTNPVVEIASNPFAVALTDLPNSDVTVYVGSDPAGAVTFVPSEFPFSSTTLNPISFTIKASSTGNAGSVIAYFTFGGNNAAWYQAQNYTIYPQPRTIIRSPAYDSIFSAPFIKPDTQSQDIRISLQYPPPSDVKLTPYADGIQFSPPELLFDSTTDSAQFSFVASTAGAHTISWIISGTDAALYNAAYLPNNTITVGTRPFDVTTPPSNTFSAGGTTTPFTISTQYPPGSDVTITLTATSTCTPTTSTVTLNPDILNYSPDTLSQTFTISSDVPCTSVTLTAVLGGTDKDLYDLPYLGGVNIRFSKLSLASIVNTNPLFLGTLQCGDSTTYSQTVNSPPPRGFSATLSAPGATFSPPTLEYSPDVLTQTFTVTSTYYQTGITIHYTVDGADVPLLTPITDRTISVSRKIATVPTSFGGPFYAGLTSSPVEVSLNYPPSSEVTVTPSATGLIFDPQFVTFSPTDTSKWFTVRAPAVGTFPVTYTLSGTDAGCYSLTTTTFSVTAVQTFIQLNPNYFPNLALGTQSVPFTLSIANLAQPVTITPVAQDQNGNPVPEGIYTFSPPSLDLTVEKPSDGFTYVVTQSRTGANDKIYFQVDGDGKDLVAPYSVVIGAASLRTFKTPAYLSTSSVGGLLPATFVQGIVSPTYTVTTQLVGGLFLPVLNDVTLTPYEPNSVFEPQVLEFGQGATSATFTITPLTGAANPGLAKTITWTVGGTDAALYSPPGSNSYFSILRDIKVSQVNNIGSNYVYVNSLLTFTIVTPYPPENPLTINLSAGDDITLSPSTLTIDSTTTTATFTATPLVKGTGLPIKVVITGDDASKYVTIPDILIYTQQSSFTVTFPTPSPSPAVLVYGQDSFVFNVRAQSSPKTSVILSIFSQQVTISPATYEFKPGYESYDFALQPILSAFPPSTTVNVGLTFVLSGDDAALFDVPTDKTFQATITTPLRQITVSPPNYIYLTNGATSFTISSTVPAKSEVTITPTTPTDEEFVFNPPSVTLTSSKSTAILTVTKTSTTLPRNTYTPIVFGVSGPDAYLYADPGTTYVYAIAGTINTNTLSGTTAFVVNQPKSFPISLSSFAGDSFTIIPKVAAGQPLTFTPPTIKFNKGDIASTFTITPTGAGTSRIAFLTEGPGAAAYSPKDDIDITIAQGTISFTNSFSFNIGGQTRTGLVTLNTPALNGLTVTVNAPGLIVTPPVISFAPGAVSAPITVNITASGITGYYTTSLGGDDAGLFVNPYPNPQSYAFSSSAPSVTATATSTSNTYLQQTVNFYLSTAAQVLPLTITPSGTGLTFVPASISIYDSTTTSVSLSVYGTTAGTANIYYALSGPGAQYFTVPSLFANPVTTTFFAYPFSVYNTYSGNTAPVGTASTPYVISVPGPANTVPTVWITPTANIPGIDFIPPVFFINSTTPSTTWAWRSNLTVGNFIVSFTLSGPGAAAYTPIAPFTATVTPVTFLLPAFENPIVVPSGAPFVYGLQSPNYAIYARAVPAEVTIQLVSEQLEIHPTTITLTPSVQQAYFDFIPRKVGPATISYYLLGNNTALYQTPGPSTGILVNYRVHFPNLPQLQVGQTSPALSVSIEPVPITTYILSITGSSTIVFSPNRLVFSPGVTNQQFTIIPLAPTIYRTNFNIPGTNPGSVGSFGVQLYGSDGIDGQQRAVVLLPPVSVIVTPGTFTILHPRYQLDVKTTISVTVSVAPRSDVVLTLLANNIQFVNAPYVIFSKDGPYTQEIEVIPRHTTSYELDYASFKVDYLVGGTNANDYFAPSETLHYIAIPMGYIAAIILVPLAVIVIIIIVIVILSKGKSSSARSVSVNS
jgi:hypothetical protein